MDKTDIDSNKENNKEEILIGSISENESMQIKPEFSKKKIIIIIVIISTILLIIGSLLLLYFLVIKKEKESNESKDKEEEDPYKIPISEEYYYDSNEVIKNYTINNDFIKLGIISDFQLNTTSEYYIRNIRKTLEKMKKENVDVILMAGDIVEYGIPSDYKLYKSIFNDIFPDSNKMPLVFEAMGNHEYYTSKYKIKGYSLKKNIQMFKDNYNKYPFYHFKINQFHFIFWSMQSYDSDEKYQVHKTWLQKHIELAENDLKQKGDPIFVITHAPAKNTVYGSDENSGLYTTYNVLKNYENVFCISGHSHRSMRNERSIWQKDFTGINTQSIAYVALSYKYINNHFVVKNSVDSYMGYIAYLYNDKMDIHRYYFHIDEQLEPWYVKFPLEKNNFNYTDDKRKMMYGIPKIWNTNIEINKIDKEYQVKYYQAWHDLAIHSYIFKYTDINKKQKEIYVYGDYYLYNYTNNSTEPKYLTVSDIDVNEKYSLTAVDFFDNMAEY